MLVALVLVVALAVPFFASGFQTLELAYALIFAIAILGLNILTGFSGQISLGHGAFLAIGAFTTADRRAQPAAALPGDDSARRTVVRRARLRDRAGRARLEGIYLGLATFAMGVATPDLLKKQTSITGGVKGISLPPVSSPRGGPE